MLFAWLPNDRNCDPIGLEEIGQEHDGTESPGDGISPGNGGQLRYKFHRNGDIADTDQTPAGQHGKHWHCGLACAPHDAGDAMGEG